jgi:hypothetical protein
VLSQYRNLLHHYIHQTSCEDATTFWSGCGAILRSAFLASGGFDPAYDRPSVEDIDLGVRLRRAGQRIVLNKELQVKHLKRWSLWSIVRCDFWQRGVPWTLLIHREGSAPNDLNLKRSHRVAGGLALALLLSLAFGAAFFESLVILPLLIAGMVVAIDRYSMVRPLSDGAILLAVAATSVGLGMYFYESAMALHSFRLWLAISLALAGGIVALNFDFYRFCARLKGPGFALLVLPAAHPLLRVREPRVLARHADPPLRPERTGARVDRRRRAGDRRARACPADTPRELSADAPARGDVL